MAQIEKFEDANIQISKDTSTPIPTAEYGLSERDSMLSKAALTVRELGMSIMIWSKHA